MSGTPDDEQRGPAALGDRSAETSRGASPERKAPPYSWSAYYRARVLFLVLVVLLVPAFGLFQHSFALGLAAAMVTGLATIAAALRVIDFRCPRCGHAVGTQKGFMFPGPIWRLGGPPLLASWRCKHCNLLVGGTAD